MQRLLVSVYACGFSASTTENDVLSFVQPHKPYDVRLRCQRNGPCGAQVAFIDFFEDEPANAFIAEKNNSRFMGCVVRLRLAFVKKNGNKSSKSCSRNNNDNNIQAVPKRRKVPEAQQGIACGSFDIIASVSNTRFVALETRWRKDMARLAEGLENYAQSAKCGVDHMEPNVLYACKDRVSGSWRRCRKVADEADLYAVEFIDHGGLTMLTKDNVLELPQLYRDWKIRAVNLWLEGYRAASGSMENFHRVQNHVLGKTFDLTYVREQRRQDPLCVLDMQRYGKSVLHQLIKEELVIKKSADRNMSQKLITSPVAQCPVVAGQQLKSPARKMSANQVEAMRGELVTVKLLIGRLCLSTALSPTTAERLEMFRHRAQTLMQNIEAYNVQH